jgi:uncharacterized membrane protein
MKAALATALFLLAGCTTRNEPLSLVDNPRYQAIGGSPFWLLAVGEDVIVLRLHHDSIADSKTSSLTYRARNPRADYRDGTKIWEAGSGTALMRVEARRGTCRRSDGATYQDEVRVRHAGRELRGCGGRMISGGRH